ncbi:MAG: hypothetical protein H7330_04110 [Hymenobacteraceae bacterium]|nr:hypothetical protein [Hymenobacteraceae bacterium]
MLPVSASDLQATAQTWLTATENAQHWSSQALDRQIRVVPMLPVLPTALAPRKGHKAWRLAFGFAVAVLLTACAPDRDITPAADCQLPPTPQNLYGLYWLRTNGWRYYYPVINPANPQQYGLSELPPDYARNLDSTTDGFTLFGPDTPDSSRFRLRDIWLPSWSRRGWIAAADYNGFLWLIKANGDSLTSLRRFQTAYCENPQWLPDGVHLLYGQNSRIPATTAIYIIDLSLNRKQVYLWEC